jgi:tetratricopeptide (TPR) repeat protein/thiol-disulfide isomerase/thioredoxin
VRRELGRVKLRPAETPLPPDTRTARVALMTRVPMPEIRYQTVDGEVVTERFDHGTPILVNLFASWCRPCIEELVQLGPIERRISDAGLKVISLSVDRLGERTTSDEDVAKVLSEIRYPLSWGFIDTREMTLLQELHDQFFFQKRPLPLPSSLLIDRDGRLSVIYRGSVSFEQLQADVNRGVGDYRQSAMDAACLPGRPLDHPRVHEVSTRSDLQTRYRAAAWLEESRRYADALKHFRDLVQRDPQWALPRRHVAKLYLEQHQLDLAYESARQALDLDPADARAHQTMGLILSARGDQVQAEHHLRTAIKLDARFEEAHNNLGIVLASQGRLDEAVRFFERAIQLDPRFVEAHINLGSAFAGLDNIARAIQHYRRALVIDPNQADAYNSLGSMYARQGQMDAAIVQYQNALRLDPNNQAVRRNLSLAIENLKGRADRHPAK